MNVAPVKFPRSEAVKEEIDMRLDKFFSDTQTRAKKISPRYAELWSSIRQTVLSGGKRIRPYIVVLSYLASGDKETVSDSVYEVAMAVELLHNAMLIHDDIIDRDFVRHGVKNITGVYREKYQEHNINENDRQHYAESAAIIAGDLLLSASQSMIAKVQYDNDQARYEVARNFDDAIFRVCGGELLDTESAFTSQPTSSLVIAREKTASYSFEMPLAVGAILAGSDTKYVEKLAHSCGVKLGIAFQLQDDILGTFGDEKKLGKTTIGDIREGKHTFMVEQFEECATQAQKQVFYEAFANPDVSEQQQIAARDMLKQSGALEATRQYIHTLTNEMEADINMLSIDAEAKQVLLRLIHRCIKREV